MGPTVDICFVCTGNICRSPTAEAVMADLLARSGLQHRAHAESAGTGGWHVGEGADSRTVAEAHRRGVDLSRHRAQQFTRRDFARFDLVLAMDQENLRALGQLAPAPDARAQVRLLRAFDPAADGDLAVPDPYYGGPEGFAQVFDMVQAACRGLLVHLLDGPLR